VWERCRKNPVFLHVDGDGGMACPFGFAAGGQKIILKPEVL
jgi:hypothetical protein